MFQTGNSQTTKCTIWNGFLQIQSHNYDVIATLYVYIIILYRWFLTLEKITLLHMTKLENMLVLHFTYVSKLFTCVIVYISDVLYQQFAQLVFPI